MLFLSTIWNKIRWIICGFFENLCSHTHTERFGYGSIIAYSLWGVSVYNSLFIHSTWTMYSIRYASNTIDIDIDFDFAPLTKYTSSTQQYTILSCGESWMQGSWKKYVIRFYTRKCAFCMMRILISLEGFFVCVWNPMNSICAEDEWLKNAYEFHC